MAAVNPELLQEEYRKDVEADLEKVITKAGGCGMTETEIRSLFEILMEGYYVKSK